jgi:hypothetical protein
MRAAHGVPIKKQVIVQHHHVMHLRIQTRILILIAAFTAFFLVMLSLHWERERDQLLTSLAEREIEQSTLLDRVFETDESGNVTFLKGRTRVRPFLFAIGFLFRRCRSPDRQWRHGTGEEPDSRCPPFYGGKKRGVFYFAEGLRVA